MVRVIICIMHLPIDWSLVAPLPSTRKQLKDAQQTALPLASTSTTPQLKKT